MKTIAALLSLSMLPALSQQAAAWGDEGHQVVALVAQSFLNADARKRVTALLAADTDSFTAHDIAAAATWADKFRDANINGSRLKTRQWHFVDIEIAAPNLDSACFNHPAIPAGTTASDGPADDCVVDKIQEFAAELANPATDSKSKSRLSKSSSTSWVTCISRFTVRTTTTRAATRRGSQPQDSRREASTISGTRGSSISLDQMRKVSRPI